MLDLLKSKEGVTQINKFCDILIKGTRQTSWYVIGFRTNGIHRATGVSQKHSGIKTQGDYSIAVIE